MTSKVIKEKLNAWQKEINDIKEKIDKLNDEKTKVNADIQAALKGKNPDEVISTQQAVTRLNEQIEALKLIEENIKNTHPVDHETFRKEYEVFREQQREILSKEYEKITNKLNELEYAYVNYDSAYRIYSMFFKEWQKLAGEIGLPLQSMFKSNTQKHNIFKNDLSRIIRLIKGDIL